MGSIPVLGRTSSVVRQRVKTQILLTGKLVSTVISQQNSHRTVTCNVLGGRTQRKRLRQLRTLVCVSAFYCSQQVLSKTDKSGLELAGLQSRLKMNTSLCANVLELKLCGKWRSYGTKKIQLLLILKLRQC